MARLPIRRRPTPEQTASLLAAVAPLVPEAARSRHIRRAVGVTRNVSTIVTTVPFVPLPARVAAGALTGVATAVDAALRPFGERPTAPTAPPPDDDQILHDPALFAADAASALATGALAAGRALATGVTSPLLRRTVKIAAIAGVVVSIGALGYRLVVAPALRRRRQRRHDAMALIVVPEEVLTPSPDAGIDAADEAGIAAAARVDDAEGRIVAAVEAADAAGTEPGTAPDGAPDPAPLDTASGI
jgi:hypothetical protein